MPEKIIIGNAELWHGDSMEILPSLPSVDLLLTDPPYGINADKDMHKDRGRVKRANGGISRVALRHYNKTDWDSAPIPDWFILKLLEKSQYQIIFGGNFYALPPTSCVLVWDKKNGASHFADCELAWTNLNKAVRKIEWLWNGFVREGGEKRYNHPTQKPVKVMEWCISQAPPKVETVLDPFMGSGTTGVACAHLGKSFIGIERERMYFDVACERIAKAQMQERLPLPDMRPDPIQESLL